MEMQCTHQDIFSRNHPASYLCQEVALKSCAETQNFINFFEFHWCDIDGKLWLMILIALFLIFLIFKYTSITVEEYIAEGIQNISDWLGLSDSLAAVTLLAFANGAGDVITAIVASDADGGVSYNIGSLFGAGLFVCSMVVAICILQSKDPMVFDKMIIFRDVGFYIGATVLIICFALYKWITWWSSVILLGYYLLLVLVVVVLDEKETDNPDGHPLANGESVKAGSAEEGSAHKSVQSHDRKEVAAIFGPLMLAVGNQESNVDLLQGILHAVHLNSLSDQLRIKLEYIKNLRRKPESAMSVWEIFMHFIEAPFMVLLILTVLPCDKEQYSKKRCLFYPIPGMLFAQWVIFQEFKYEHTLVSLSLALALLLLFMTTLEEDKIPSYFIWINILGVVGGLMWTYILVGILIDLLGCMGILLNLDKTYLGLTVLAVGNALPDALTTIALCKQGAGTMALSGGYAGQLFGLLVGFGISMLKLTIKEGPQAFDLFDPTKLHENVFELMVIGTIMVALLLTYMYAYAKRMVMDKTIGVILLLIYGAFIVVTTVIAVKRAVQTSPQKAY